MDWKLISGLMRLSYGRYCFGELLGVGRWVMERLFTFILLQIYDQVIFAINEIVILSLKVQGNKRLTKYSSSWYLEKLIFMQNAQTLAKYLSTNFDHTFIYNHFIKFSCSRNFTNTLLISSNSKVSTANLFSIEMNRNMVFPLE